MKTMIIDGKEIMVKKFFTRNAAENYMKKTFKKLVFFKSHQYYVG